MLMQLILSRFKVTNNLCLSANLNYIKYIKKKKNGLLFARSNNRFLDLKRLNRY